MADPRPFDALVVAVIDETAGKISQQPAVAFEFAQYYPAPIAGEVATCKVYFNFSVS